jgi:hypothetical protein
VCDRCGTLEEVIETMSHANAREQQAREECERDLRMYRARLTRLENELEEKRGNEVEGRKILALIEKWKLATGHTQAKASTIGKRAEYIRKAFKLGYDEEKLSTIFEVAGRYPFVDPRRSRHPSCRCSTGDTLRDDIPTLLKDEVTMDRLLDLAENPSQPVARPEEPGEVTLSVQEQWRQLNYPNAIVMAALWDLGMPVETPRPDVWTTHCPVCTNPTLIARRNGAGLMSVDCARGCEFWRLLAALKLQASDLFENAEHDPARRDADEPMAVPAHLTEAAGVLMSRLSGVAGSANGV